MQDALHALVKDSHRQSSGRGSGIIPSPELAPLFAFLGFPLFSTNQAFVFFAGVPIPAKIQGSVQRSLGKVTCGKVPYTGVLFSLV